MEEKSGENTHTISDQFEYVRDNDTRVMRSKGGVVVSYLEKDECALSSGFLDAGPYSICMTMLCTRYTQQSDDCLFSHLFLIETNGDLSNDRPVSV